MTGYDLGFPFFLFSRVHTAIRSGYLPEILEAGIGRVRLKEASIKQQAFERDSLIR
jgi:hypothetical protein